MTIPLVIDLDGTLLRSDLLVECGLALFRAHPAAALASLGWLASGKAYLKQRLAETTEIDVRCLPYNPQVIELAERERAKGRPIILATASHKIYAERIASHLRLFDRVLATDGDTNLSAYAKRDRLVEEFGEGGFDYVGNSSDDQPVWAAARCAYVVGPGRAGAKAKAREKVERLDCADVSPFRTWTRALRFHQWLKNLLIFVPLLASHQWGNGRLLLTGVLAFVLFGLCASSVYLLNDLLDLADDRYHPTKCRRPFAAGLLSLTAGLCAVPALLATSFAGALWLLPWQFSAALGGYYMLTLAYSISLKRLMLVDALTLAILYTLRIVAGTYAFGVSLTFWMLAFSMFIFLSLAFVKRYAELWTAYQEGKTEKIRGRGYYPGDLPMLASLGSAAGYLSVLVLALYIQSKSTMMLYSHPKVIWLACPVLLFWISRVWLLTHRGQMHEDPVVFAVTDRVSLLVGVLFCAIFWVAA